LFGGQRIDKTLPERIVKLGIAQSPQGRKLFPQLSVLENLRIGCLSDSEPKRSQFYWLEDVFDISRDEGKD